MKIFQLIDIPWDSGLAHYALALSEGLKKRGHQVFISAIPGQKPWLKAKRLGLKTVPLATLKGLQPLRRFLKEHQIDLLNAHTGSTHSLAVAATLGQKVAVVRTRSDARRMKSRVGTTFLFKHTQRVIAAADYIRDDYLKILKLPSGKVVTIYQGVALDDFDVKPLPAKPVIGMVARLDPVKGHRYMIEALSLLKNSYPELTLDIVGQEENIKKHELFAMAERLRIENRIDFQGFQSSVPSVMARCSIGVIASTGSEAVSRAALEWMAAGRPVVATKVGCLSEIVEDGVTGRLVDPRDAPQLAIALGILLHDPVKAAEMGKAGRKRAQDLFNIPDFVEKTLETYHAALRDVK